MKTHQYSGADKLSGLLHNFGERKSVQSELIDARLLNEEFLTHAVVKLIRPSLFQPVALQYPGAQLPNYTYLDNVYIRGKLPIAKASAQTEWGKSLPATIAPPDALHKRTRNKVT